jgi:GalNAc-alpha-(1->4)-GalNAc-alpha-(1->3)-diNAcBac-PP-undecaprenol alpha-1,4-N-acetyl-D-galactosaminyltransferase
MVFVVPNQDIAALAGAMESLMSNEQKRQQLAVKAPEVLERFGLEAIVVDWEALIQKLMEKKNK